MIKPEHAALLMIDMQYGFIDEGSSLCIAGARATLSACKQALDAARSHGIVPVHVRREYAADGSNVESTRYETWLAGGKPLSQASTDPASLDFPPETSPHNGETVVVKPRFSAFFGTNLDALLRAQGITTVVLAGTTTPNCIRSTCYDALSLDYNVVVLKDATSSRTPEVQRANIEDMAFIGAQIMGVSEFAAHALESTRDIVAEQRAKTAAGA